MSILIKGMEMPQSCLECRLFNDPWCMAKNRNQWRTAYNRPPKGEKQKDCPLVEVPTPHGRLIDADTLTVQMERNLWVIEDKAEKELGFDETLRRGMQYGHAVCLNAVNTTPVIFVPQIVRCCECEYNNHCLTQEFVKEECRTPFDKNTWFCADAKAAPTVIPSDKEET